MSTRTVTVTIMICDLCGYDSTFVGPEYFTTDADGVTLCRRCASPPAKPGAQIWCGEHLVTFSADAKHWTCSCGHAYRKPILLSAKVRDAVPSLVTAIAFNHAETP